MKKIVFVADSTADLIGLASRLNNDFEIIWLTYHKAVYLELKRLNYKKVYFCNLSKKLKPNDIKTNFNYALLTGNWGSKNFSKINLK